MLDLAQAYSETHQHLADVALVCTQEELVRRVPASPAWSVKDVVGHVTGVAVDAAGGRLPPDLDLLRRSPNRSTRRGGRYSSQSRCEAGGSGASRRCWRNGQPLRELLPMIRGERPFPRPVPLGDAIVLTDLAVHAQDVRGALGKPGDRDSAGVSVALIGYCTGTALRLAMRGLPSLRLRYGDKERSVGEGEPGATLSADRFELFRAFAGRRSRDQILAMGWEGDPGPYVDLIPAYGPRTDPVED